jgi:hypothetical protein
MVSEGQSLRNRVIPPQPPQPRRGRGGRSPTSRVAPDLSRNDKDTENEDELIARSSRTTKGAGATPTDAQVDLTAKGPAKEAESSAGTTKAQCPEATGLVEGQHPTFDNIDDELAYYEALAARQDKERRLAELRRKVQGKAVHSLGVSLKALAKPPPEKRSVVAVEPMRRVTVMPPEYSGHNAKELAELIRKAENVFEADEVLFPTDRAQMLFAQPCLTGDAPTLWWQHREKHPEAAWSHMKTLLTDLTALPQQRSDHAIQQLRNAKQGKDQSLTAFTAYVTSSAQGTQISNYDKRLFLRTRMRPEICAALLRGVKHPTFDTLLEACLYVEADLCLEADFRKGKEKSAFHEKAPDKPEKPRNESGGCCSSSLSRSRGGGSFRGRGHGRGRGGHAQRGGHTQPKGDGGAPQASGASRRPGTCHNCGKKGHWASECYSKAPEASGTALHTPKPKSGKEKAQ